MAQLKNYAVTFIGSYYVLTTNAEARSPQHAEKVARQLLLDHHGLDMDSAQVVDVERGN